KIAAMSAQQSWRHANFGSASNTGSAADTFDFEGDGVPNLVEWALHLNPTTSSALPVAGMRQGNVFVFTYTRSVAAVNAGVQYAVEWSDTLAAGSWGTAGVSAEAILSDNGTVQVVQVTVPLGSAGRRFVHLAVTGQ
ncbi:MAG: hypothetical protein ACOYMN_22730, partial [Roseimicrobium sp.]